MYTCARLQTYEYVRYSPVFFFSDNTKFRITEKGPRCIVPSFLGNYLFFLAVYMRDLQCKHTV